MEQELTGNPYALSGLSSKRRVKAVKVGDLRLATDPRATLITYALGSCLGVTFYDSRVPIVGLGHFLLPTAPPKCSLTESRKHVNTGLDELYRKLIDAGALKRRLKIHLFGCASILKGTPSLDIGRQNFNAAAQWLKTNNLSPIAAHVGGNKNRTVTIQADTGKITIRTGRDVIQI